MRINNILSTRTWRWGIPCLLFAVSCLLAGPVHAENYLSGYSYGSGGFHSWRGYRSHYLSKTGSGRYTSTHVDRPHQASYRRLVKAKEEETAKHEWYNTHPPCGVYGRVPERCKVMEPQW